MSFILLPGTLGTIRESGSGKIQIIVNNLMKCDGIYLGVTTNTPSQPIVFTFSVSNPNQSSFFKIQATVNPVTDYKATVSAISNSVLIPIPIPKITTSLLIDTDYPFNDGDAVVRVSALVFTDTGQVK